MATNTTPRFPAAPNLPLAPGQWDARFQEQFANVLRLYFNQLGSSLNVLTNNQTALQDEANATQAELWLTLNSGIWTGH